MTKKKVYFILKQVVALIILTALIFLSSLILSSIFSLNVYSKYTYLDKEDFFSSQVFVADNFNKLTIENQDKILDKNQLFVNINGTSYYTNKVYQGVVLKYGKMPESDDEIAVSAKSKAIDKNKITDSEYLQSLIDSDFNGYKIVGYFERVNQEIAPYEIITRNALSEKYKKVPSWTLYFSGDKSLNDSQLLKLEKNNIVIFRLQNINKAFTVSYKIWYNIISILLLVAIIPLMLFIQSKTRFFGTLFGSILSFLLIFWCVSVSFNNMGLIFLTKHIFIYKFTIMSITVIAVLNLFYIANAFYNYLKSERRQMLIQKLKERANRKCE